MDSTNIYLVELNINSLFLKYFCNYLNGHKNLMRTAKSNIKTILISAIVASTLAGCATTSSKVVETPTVASYNTTYTGTKSKLVVGQFVNRSSFQNGIFSSGQDRLGNQAKTTLMSHLQQTNRFSVLDRDNMAALADEAKLTGTKQVISGAKFVVTGDVTEFGRKAIGDRQLFGLLGKGKSQIAYAKVTLNIVDVTTSEVIYSVQGAGEYSLSEREVVGFGSTASYDATLNGKVLDLAIREVVNKLVTGLESGQWGDK
jgi:curli biogenesis system outer membrane secretion channel CsgG